MSTYLQVQRSMQTARFRRCSHPTGRWNPARSYRWIAARWGGHYRSCWWLRFRSGPLVLLLFHPGRWLSPLRSRTPRIPRHAAWWYYLEGSTCLLKFIQLTSNMIILTRIEGNVPSSLKLNQVYAGKIMGPVSQRFLINCTIDINRSSTAKRVLRKLAINRKPLWNGAMIKLCMIVTRRSKVRVYYLAV